MKNIKKSRLYKTWTIYSAYFRQGRNQEGLNPFQKILSRALAEVQIFSEGVQTLLGAPLTLGVYTKPPRYKILLLNVIYT